MNDPEQLALFLGSCVGTPMILAGVAVLFERRHQRALVIASAIVVVIAASLVWAYLQNNSPLGTNPRYDGAFVYLRRHPEQLSSPLAYYGVSALVTVWRAMRPPGDLSFGAQTVGVMLRGLLSLVIAIPLGVASDILTRHYQGF